MYARWRDFSVFHIVKQSDDFQYICHYVSFALAILVCVCFFFLLLSFELQRQPIFIHWIFAGFQFHSFTYNTLRSFLCIVFTCLYFSTISTVVEQGKKTRLLQQNGILWLAKVYKKPLHHDSLYYPGGLNILHTISTNISILFSMLVSLVFVHLYVYFFFSFSPFDIRVFIRLYILFSRQTR